MKDLEVLEVGSKIQSQVKSELQKNQREYYLREQMKAIQKELGDSDDQQREISELREKIEAAGMPEEAKKEAVRELERLSRMSPAAAEYTVTRTYLDWVVALPWNKRSEVEIDLVKAKEVLDNDHYDLEKVKDRILEYLAVRKMKPDLKGPILCFVGPPGVGKTTLGKSIASALGRKFHRLSLGGMRDEAEIRGHRRTYIGALPGQIIQGLRRAESKNPVIMLDEVDKIGADFRGDPSAALLEVLDPEQNNSFKDHYIDLPFDLSEVLFITTANILDTVPPALRDRMEVIRLAGYTEEEKLHIARRHIIPKQLDNHGLNAEQVAFGDEALVKLIREYTREAGLRNLEREVASIIRKVARKKAEGQNETVAVTPERVEEYLGAPYFMRDDELTERTQIPGVATGLSWTAAGGEVLYIEATQMFGKKGLTLTGQLGDVMKESAQTALSWVRAHARQLGIEDSFFERVDLHLHVPEGAIPKDGPSAGVTLTTAIVSLLTGRPVRPARRDDWRGDALGPGARRGRNQGEGPRGASPRRQGSPASEAQREGRQGGHPREREPRPQDPAGLVDRGGPGSGAAARRAALGPREGPLASPPVELTRGQLPDDRSSASAGGGARARGGPTATSITMPSVSTASTASAKLLKARSTRGRLSARRSSASKRPSATSQTSASRASRPDAWVSVGR